jgi:Fe(II)/alpha-ketoglutarate-dependent arginine beta-hydroxylase
LRLRLNASEIQTIERLAASAVDPRRTIDDDAYLRELSLQAHELPARLRRLLCDMRHTEQMATCVVSGLPVDDAAIGPTPSHWVTHAVPSSTAREEAVLLMCGSLLGDIFGWATQQNGAIVHDILPIRGEEYEQLGSGSESPLKWHTEDAFHPLRCDYLGLMCIRNIDGVATTIAAIDDIALSDEDLDVLFQPRFLIRPDTSHLGPGNGPSASSAAEAGLLAAARTRVSEMNTAPQPVAVLYGARDTPYMCADPCYMTALPADACASAALQVVEREVTAHLRDLVLEPGDICFIDNFRVVHGRNAFTPRYDGTDRWLKRVNITRDLRRSRSHRLSSGSRIIY